MGMSLQLQQVLRCSVCGQIRDEDQAAHDAVDVALFGAVAYAVCPGCGLVVQDHEDPEYRARVDERVGGHG